MLMLKHMEVVTVTFGKLHGVGYDKSTNTLIIELKKKKIYMYDEVPPNIYTELMAAESKEKFYTENIKSKFNCERID